ncbi:hypothetical protein RhiirA4_475673 [Rhizophagus irregularis]|uniref:Uncharacterized protein n=1 Tax=Rhizophagus irregularis TaxID=588596 RepID=A0A2I1HAF7_9GLOM|nr:hypothetical protein RhiirA4_475673 [Rhizophagus irregularis]
MIWRRLLVSGTYSCAFRYPIVDTLARHKYWTSFYKWDLIHSQLAKSTKHTDFFTYSKLILSYKSALTGFYNLVRWNCPTPGLVDLWGKGRSGCNKITDKIIIESFKKCGIIDLLVDENVKIDKGSETEGKDEKSEIEVKLETEKESETEVELEANNGESEIEE